MNAIDIIVHINKKPKQETGQESNFMVAKKSTTAATTPDRQKLFDSIVADVKKEFGDDAAVVANGNIDVETISTGSWVVDSMLGGGFPRGRIIEIYGPEASGKTSLALNAIADVQKHGGNAVFIDLEQALDPRYAATLGVNIDKLIVCRPTSGEQAATIMEKFILSGVVDIIVLDSVAALISEKELAGEIDKDQIGLRARLVGRMMTRILSPLAKTGTTCILINQERVNVGVMYGNPNITMGGNAIKYFASQRIRVSRQKPEIDSKTGELIGTPVKVVVKKNKIAPPLREGEFWIMNGIGVDKINELFDLCVKFGILKKSGSFIKDAETGETIAQGKAKVVAMLRENENGLYDKYEPLMLACLNSTGSADTQTILQAALERGDDDALKAINKSSNDDTEE